MVNEKFQIGDWLISDTAERPEARQYTHISKHGGYGVDNEENVRFSLDTKLRKAYSHEIPEYARQKELLIEIW